MSKIIFTDEKNTDLHFTYDGESYFLNVLPDRSKSTANVARIKLSPQNMSDLIKAAGSIYAAQTQESVPEVSAKDIQTWLQVEMRYLLATSTGHMRGTRAAGKTETQRDVQERFRVGYLRKAVPE